MRRTALLALQPFPVGLLFADPLPPRVTANVPHSIAGGSVHPCVCAMRFVDGSQKRPSKGEQNRPDHHPNRHKSSPAMPWHEFHSER